jgi:hypothetical protein
MDQRGRMMAEHAGICAASGLLLALSFVLPPSADLIRLFLIVVIFLYHAHLLGRHLLRERRWSATLALGMVLLAGIQSLIQTAWYYLGGMLGVTSDAGALFISVIIVHLFCVAIPAREDEEAPEPFSFVLSRRVLCSSGLLLLGLTTASWCIRAAARAGTVESIRTPWPLLPEGMLAMILLGWIACIASVVLVRSRIAAAIQTSLALFPTLAIAPLVYRIGYGFDGFLHIASERVLLTTGTLSPKPLYYIGQYVFTTWIVRLTHVPISDIDRWLVPVATALLLPLVAWFALPRRNGVAGFLALGLIPLGAFVATTPQAFAYLLGLCALLLATRNSSHPLASLLLIGWSIAAHPLAGIPFLFVTLAVLAGRAPQTTLRRTARIVALLLAACAVPLMFAILNLRGGTSIVWNLDSILSLEPWRERLASFIPFIGNHFVLWPAWASLVQQALPLILLLLAILSAREERKSGKNGSAFTLITAAILLWISGTALSATGDFTFLIDYERGNYADRLNALAIFCLIPATIPALERLLERIRQQPKILAAAFLAGLALCMTGLAYDALPRHDALVTGRGWSTSKDDIEAVTLIDRDAAGRPYTVLANQSVSAAAVSQFGFKRYAGDVFFYPIPTGGPLYETYLRMTYNEPSRDTVADAAKLGKTHLVYIVVNKYWWKAEQVSEQIEALADRSWSIRDGAINVYAFEMSSAASASTTTSGR